MPPLRRTTPLGSEEHSPSFRRYLDIAHGADGGMARLDIFEFAREWIEEDATAGVVE